MNATPTEKLPPVTARVGKLPPGPILTVTLDPPTVAEALKHIKFEPASPFDPKWHHEVHLGNDSINRVILPEEFETTIVPDGGVVLVTCKVHYTVAPPQENVTLSCIGGAGGGHKVVELNPPTLTEALRQIGILFPEFNIGSGCEVSINGEIIGPAEFEVKWVFRNDIVRISVAEVVPNH